MPHGASKGPFTRMKKVQRQKRKRAGARGRRMSPEKGVQRTIRPRGPQLGPAGQSGSMMPYVAARNSGGNQRNTLVWGPGSRRVHPTRKEVSGEVQGAKRLGKRCRGATEPHRTRPRTWGPLAGTRPGSRTGSTEQPANSHRDIFSRPRGPAINLLFQKKVLARWCFFPRQAHSGSLMLRGDSKEGTAAPWSGESPVVHGSGR